MDCLKIWVLRPIKLFDTRRYGHTGDTRGSPWRGKYDMAFGFVICAKTEEQAREYASKLCGDEGSEAWLNKDFSTCDELVPVGDSAYEIMVDFNAG